MFEIILLFILGRNIKRTAEAKAQPSTRWILMLILNWLLFEFFMIGVATLIFGNDNIFAIMPLALAGGLCGYWLTYAQLKNMPDESQEDDPNDDEDDEEPKKDLSYFR